MEGAYNQGRVRRLSAIALIGILLSLVMLPVLLAQAASPLPVCCRAHGLHHCAAPDAGTGSKLAAPHCAAFPTLQTSLAPLLRVLITASLLFFGAVCARPALQVSAVVPIALRFLRSPDTRGPPALFA